MAGPSRQNCNCYYDKQLSKHCFSCAHNTTKCLFPARRKDVPSNRKRMKNSHSSEVDLDSIIVSCYKVIDDYRPSCPLEFDDYLHISEIKYQHIFVSENANNNRLCSESDEEDIEKIKSSCRKLVLENLHIDFPPKKKVRYESRINDSLNTLEYCAEHDFVLNRIEDYHKKIVNETSHIQPCQSAIVEDSSNEEDIVVVDSDGSTEIEFCEDPGTANKKKIFLERMDQYKKYDV